MHSVHRSGLFGLREKLFASDGARDDVAYEGVALGQVSREIHFFPLVALLDAKSRKAEVASNSVGSHEVDLAVNRFDIDIIWVFFLRHFLHPEGVYVRVQVVKHVRVLVAAEPFVLPVEPDRR